MKMYPREFPSGRRKKAKRQAERRVYEALAGAAGRGFCYYEWRKGYEHIELDYAVWIEGLGRIALQVKGGKYRLMDGDWYLVKRNGLQYIGTCPLDETKLAALDLHDDIKELAETHYSPYVIPVLMFPDMELDRAIEQLARRTGVYVIWGVGNLLSDLEDIVRSRRVSEALGDGPHRLRGACGHRRADLPGEVREELRCRCSGPAGSRPRAATTHRDASADAGRRRYHDDRRPRRADGGITARIAGNPTPWSNTQAASRRSSAALWPHPCADGAGRPMVAGAFACGWWAHDDPTGSVSIAAVSIDVVAVGCRCHPPALIPIPPWSEQL